MTQALSPRPLRAAAALGLALLGALLILAGQGVGWLLVALGLPLFALLALAGDAPPARWWPLARVRAAALLPRVPLWGWLAALWLALKIPVPLFPTAFPWLATLSTLALALAALAYAWRFLGARSLGLAALAFGVGWAVELLGSHTGFPFGPYSYAGAPGPTLAGVPLLVPLGWWGMTLSAAVLAGGRAPLAALLLVAWDIGLEPLMTAQGFWSWQDPRPLWAGAGLANFLGWAAVGGGLVWAFRRLAGARWHALLAGGFRWPYLLEAAFLPAGLLMLGLYSGGLGTGVAMGGAVALALWLGRRVVSRET